MAAMEKTIDASKWISDNHEGTFAYHVFPKKEQALEFVEELYKLGAKKVLVSNIETEDDWSEPQMYEGKPLKIYADELIVDLPEEKDKRLAIFSFINNFREDASEYYKEEGQKSISVFWDY